MRGAVAIPDGPRQAAAGRLQLGHSRGCGAGGCRRPGENNQGNLTAKSRHMYSIDIDIGGTFTDGFFSDGARIRTRKVLTTPHDVSECFMNCVRAGSETFDLELEDFLLHTEVARVSTTIGTNLLVQCAGPRIGLIVTEGAQREDRKSTRLNSSHGYIS